MKSGKMPRIFTANRLIQPIKIMLIDQIIQAVTLFGLGMGTVFVLLSLLISCVSLLSYVCENFWSQPEVVKASAVPQTKISESTQNISALEVSIVKAAVKAHREANT